MIPTHGQTRLVRRQVDKRFEKPSFLLSPLRATLPPRYLRIRNQNRYFSFTRAVFLFQLARFKLNSQRQHYSGASMAVQLPHHNSIPCVRAPFDLWAEEELTSRNAVPGAKRYKLKDSMSSAHGLFAALNPNTQV